MDGGNVPIELVGREPAIAAVQRWAGLLADGPAGLVIEGEAGIGKTAVWARATALAAERNMRVLVARPAQAELALGYAGLGDLLLGVAEPWIGRLPSAQARALSAALSLSVEPDASDPLLVARATLTLLQALAEEQPVVLAVDDVQWLDAPSARAVRFVARRLGGARVGIAVTRRDLDPEPLDLAAALGDRSVTIRLAGLSFGAIGRLVRERIDPAISRRRLLNIHERSVGNPFFAFELARTSHHPDQLPPTLSDLVARRLAEAVAGRPAIEMLAVVGPAPIDAFPDPVALDEAVAHGVLVEQSGTIRFSHPLLAAGAYQAIPPARRRELHRHAAAGATSIEERARHLALAADGPDAGVASLLDDAASQAFARGAPETAAQFSAHARRLSPADDGALRARRLMDEAEALLHAADEVAARTLADELLAGPAPGRERVRALFLRALTARDPGEAVADLEVAAAEAHDDARLGVRTLAQLAWQRGAWLGNPDVAVGEADVALAAAHELGDPEALAVALTTAGHLRSVAGRPGAADLLRQAVEIIGASPRAAGDKRPRLAYAHERWWRGDFAAADVLLADERRVAEDHGDDGLTMRLDVFEAELALRRGRWDEASRRIDEALIAARGYWRVNALARRVLLRARRGDTRAIEDVDEIHAWASSSNDPGLAAFADVALGLLDQAAGRLEAAAARAAAVLGPSQRMDSRALEIAVTIPEAVSMLVEGDRLDTARALVGDLERRSGQLAPWGDAAAALCRGLIAHAAGRPEDALGELAEARDGFQRLQAPWELAQSLGAEGSALRRLGHRREAAAAIAAALEIQLALGADPAVRRSREELQRAQPRPRHDDTLTETEAKVAALAARGLTNREIAARQFTTVATVEAHLTRIYSKLGVRSRTELARQASAGAFSPDP